MGSAFLILLREGLEMALIIAILLAYVRKVGERGDARAVWLGTAAASAVAIVAGIVVFILVGELHGRVEEITEGIIALIAGSVLTWMVFWMRAQARSLRTGFHARIDAASGSALAVAGIAFVSILREGLETALFLLGSTVGDERAFDRFVGGIVGLAAAIGLGVLIYRGSKKLDLRAFFKVTGIFVLLFAAGLFAKAVAEFQEAHVFGTLWAHVWNLEGVGWLNPESGSRVAEFLKGLFGWNPAPSIESVAAWLAAAIPMGIMFLRGTRNVPQVTTPAREEVVSPS